MQRIDLFGITNKLNNNRNDILHLILLHDSTKKFQKKFALISRINIQKF